jgi:hypothetical protein
MQLSAATSYVIDLAARAPVSLNMLFPLSAALSVTTWEGTATCNPPARDSCINFEQ